MKNYIIILFSTTLLLCCSNKPIQEEDSFTKTLTLSAWTICEIWLDPEQDGIFEKTTIPDCETDNRHTFNADGTFSYDTGEVACEPTQIFVVSGKWESSENDTVLKLVDLPDDIEYKVVSIAEKELILRPVTTLEPNGSVNHRFVLRR
jgi:Lipocalin-like domain